MDCSHVQFCVHDGTNQSQCSSGCPSEVNLHQLQALFQTTAFWARDRRIDHLEIALANSKPIVSAWDMSEAKSPEEARLVGFARATSDGIYRATIWDVVIHPDYQGAGLGRKLVETILAHPHVSQVERVYLMTTKQQAFYRRIGFEENQTTTMVLFRQSELAESADFAEVDLPEEVEVSRQAVGSIRSV
jgi:GNAT superfamily N-acetyltransferase